MSKNPNRRRRSKTIIKSDNFFAWAVPLLFMGIAVYQQIANGQIEKIIIGVLVVFGLAAAGWRIDVFFDTYMRAKYGTLREEDPPPEMPARKAPRQINPPEETDDRNDNGDDV